MGRHRGAGEAAEKREQHRVTVPSFSTALTKPQRFMGTRLLM